MSTEKQIQWYPGHMAKTKRLMKESLPLVDAVCEILDARIPVSCRNPDLSLLAANKPRIILLNKSDLADPAVTAGFVAKFKEQGITAVEINAKTKMGINRFFDTVNTVLAQKIEQNRKKGINKSLKLMVAGIPNVGKSTFINSIADKKAKVEDRPGVTRENRWFAAQNNLMLMDTPGVLWLKFDDETVARRLAFTGAVKDTVLDTEEIAYYLIKELIELYPELLCGRYGLNPADFEEPYDYLCAVGKKRGMLISGGEIDTVRTSNMLLDEFRGGVIGRISLDRI
ncbi:MAG: ribosome biogenesis GTPase YlqF [Oscillospiraceae bacterium]|nr:ribosome biogenesis GTPase YlqF [Candidatus Equicaccousia limihippi]